MHPCIICLRPPFVFFVEPRTRRSLRWPWESNQFFWRLERVTGDDECAGRKKWHPTRRTGAATVEFAIVAPIVFLVVLGLVQFASLLMCQNMLTVAAREGARLASMSSTISKDLVVSEMEERLSHAGIDPNQVTINVNPTNLGSLNTGDEVSISVSVPLSEMGWIWAIAPPNANLTAEITHDCE